MLIESTLYQDSADDKAALSETYFKVTGSRMNWKSPRGFFEKMAWLKIFDRRSEMVQIVDKATAGCIARSKCRQVLVPSVYGIYSAPHEINWDALPEHLVVKATHGSKMVKKVDKREMNVGELEEMMSNWLQTTYGKQRREWVYKHVEPKIMIEEVIGYHRETINDYKFYCFEGEPLLVHVDVCRNVNHQRAFFDPHWNRVNFEFGRYSVYQGDLEPPAKLSDMLDFARKMSKGFHFLRVDMYSIEDTFYFGEATLFPGGGWARLYPKNANATWGAWLTNVPHI